MYFDHVIVSPKGQTWYTRKTRKSFLDIYKTFEFLFNRIKYVGNLRAIES